MIRVRKVATASLIALLSACGGGSENGGAAPTPMPIPTPTPTPTPAPTTFSVVAAGPVLARALFDVNGDGSIGEALSTTNANGEFGQGVAVLNTSLNSGNAPTSPTLRMGASGIDVTTGLTIIDMTAPVGATVISPLTTLIDIQGGAGSVRSALGLDNGPNALRGETDLLKFNPALNWRSNDTAIARDAGRLTTINMQLLALAAYITEFSDPVDTAISLAKASRHISGAMVTRGTLDLTNSADIEAIMSAANPNPDPSIPAEWRQSRADLIAKYMAAMPVRLTSEEEVRAWAYAFRFYILPELLILGRTWPNPAAARIAAIQTADIVAAAESLRSAPTPAIGTLMAVPDYREVTASPSSAYPAYSLALSECNWNVGSGVERLPGCNDWQPFIGVQFSELVAIQATEPNNLAVNLTNGSVQFNRVGSFTGLTRVTYAGRLSSGETATGVIFVRVREPD